MTEPVKSIATPIRFSNSEPIKVNNAEMLNDVTITYQMMKEGISKEEYENATDSQKQLISVFLNTVPRAKSDNLSSKLGKEDVFLRNGEIDKIQKNIKKEYLF